MLLIFLGVFIYHVLDFISLKVEIFLNVILVLFLLRFIRVKFKEFKKNYKIENIKRSQNIKYIILKTLGFTYLNPHVYSDTVFFLGNFSKSFMLIEKVFFGLGAGCASFIFFFAIGYASNYFSNFLNSFKIWKIINWMIITIMSILSFYVILEIVNYFN